MIFYFLFFFLFSTVDVHSAKLVLSTDNYAHFSNQEPVADLLSDLSVTSNIRVQISPNIKLYMNGYFEDTTVNDLFNRIISDNNLTWYYDGVVLYIYTNNDIKQKLIRLYNITPDSFKEKLVEMGIYDEKFEWKVNNNLLTVFGPPRYIEIIDEMLSIIDNQSEIGVKVFPLKYARADNYSIPTKSGEINIDGVSSLLKKLIVGENIPTFFESGEKNNYQDVLAKIKFASKDGDSKFSPQITADVRTNGIIVHDYVNKFPIYERLIGILDTEMPLIEIAITIVDLSIDHSRTIGTEWDSKFNLSDSVSGGKASVNFIGGSQFNSILQANIAPAFFLKEFLSKVKLMEKNGTGKIISRPTILTTNNLKAVLDHSKTFHIRAGFSDKNDVVSSVNVGLNLQVTPRIINNNDERMVYLDINISDGNIVGGTGVDNIPFTGQTQIVSQATIKEGYSVILGGYYYEKEDTSVKKVPILGDIPILGYLFKQKDKSFTTVERIFIITPKVVDSSEVIVAPDDVLKHVNSTNSHKNVIKDKFDKDKDGGGNYLTEVEYSSLKLSLERILSKPILAILDTSAFKFYDECKGKYDPILCINKIRKKYSIGGRIILLNRELVVIKDKVTRLVKRYINCARSSNNAEVCREKIMNSSMAEDINHFAHMKLGFDGYEKILSFINNFDICKESNSSSSFCYNNVFKLMKYDSDFDLVKFPDQKSIREIIHAG